VWWEDNSRCWIHYNDGQWSIPVSEQGDREYSPLRLVSMSLSWMLKCGEQLIDTALPGF
jgi:hypothetical protein